MKHCPDGQKIIAGQAVGWHLVFDGHMLACDTCRRATVLTFKRRRGPKKTPPSLTVFHHYEEPLSQLAFTFSWPGTEEEELIKSHLYVRILKWGDNSRVFIDVRRFIQTGKYASASYKGVSFRRSEFEDLVTRGPEILAEYDRIMEARDAPDSREDRQRLMGVRRQRLRDRGADRGGQAEGRHEDRGAVEG